MSNSHYTVTECAAFLFWEELDTPVSLGLYLLARSGDWKGVLTFKVEPGRYLNAEDYCRDNCAVTFLKKNPYIKGVSQEERKQAAIASWYESEERCFATNLRFRLLRDESTGPLWGFIQDVRKCLLEWLGTKVTDSQIQAGERHGPGSTFSDLVRDPTVADKYSAKPTLTSDAVWYLADIVGTMWGHELALPYSSSHLDCVKVVPGNRFVSVAKTALTDRGIAIEPTINIYAQLAVGGELRRRLKSNCGWDLAHAAEIHKKIACEASRLGNYATLDLSNASDTCASEVVRTLFSKTDWLDRMEDLRSKKTLIDGKWRLLDKFSSMGNGFTFELETAIFAAIACVASRKAGLPGVLGKDVFVFGDDIIVKTEASNVTQRALEFFGFKLNQEKSFTSGPFRESCGGDFFLGKSVRGYYLKRELDEPDACFGAFNGTRKAFEACHLSGDRFLKWILSRLPTVYRRIGGSSRLGDSVLHGMPAVVKWRGGIRWVRAVRWERPKVIPWKFFSLNVFLACRIDGYGSSWGISPRGGAQSGEIVWVTDS